MFYNKSNMDWLEKLSLLSQETGLELDEESSGWREASPACYTARTFGVASRLLDHISYVTLRGGQKIPVLKVLLTSACEYDCAYCPFRAGRDFRRATFEPEELARAFLQIYQAGLVKGLFLSSGVTGGGVRTQDRLIATAEILRHRLGFQGYLHLKLMPGAEAAQVERAVALASRVSINLEMPATYLQQLAPRKAPGSVLLQPLRQAYQAAQNLQSGPGHRRVSLSTQFVVGIGETDAELLRTTAYLYKQLGLSRVYYSAFHPIAQTPLEDHSPENPVRALRLYQASFLLRDYGFAFEELPLGSDGRLDLAVDPKTAWAQRYINHPLEVNRASREELLRIPGIGPKSALAIIRARRLTRLRDLRQLRQLGVNVNRAAPYLLLDGRHPEQQLTFIF
ncbi:helix-hairpin-helix domain-containing protein [uncultured Thermanaerothrix sp.]|uniref:helix-hairpin-helix domain-containing protein n=1 Tax=uncultured Thermanaerothrix sp. TaxID=1195149 RepID=UPI0026276B43|nr:helix-hairpin-helix domain-containing protein [uncultured Thermanaerothrix sp.]